MNPHCSTASPGLPRRVSLPLARLIEISHTETALMRTRFAEFSVAARAVGFRALAP
jgi:hypothetical protein